MIWVTVFLTYLAKTYANLNQAGDAQRLIGEALTTVEATKETWYEAEAHRTAGEIALISSEPDVAKAEAYFGPRQSGRRVRKAATSETLHAPRWGLDHNPRCKR